MPELNWIGKAAVVKHHKEVPFRLLEPDPALSCGDPGSGKPPLKEKKTTLESFGHLVPRIAFL